MKTFLFFFFVSCWFAVVAPAQEAIPTIRILPKDVEQGSISRSPAPFPLGTNQVTVRWTYTEAGAKKMLAFWRAYAGQRVLEQIGTFEFRATIGTTKPPNWTEEGYLKRRTDKFFAVSKEDAERIVAGLEGR